MPSVLSVSSSPFHRLTARASGVRTSVRTSVREAAGRIRGPRREQGSDRPPAAAPESDRELDPDLEAVADRARGLLRVVPFLKPHRATLFWSVGFAWLVAIFWGVNLGLVLPVVNVLAEDGGVRGYVGRETAAAEAELIEWTAKLTRTRAHLADLEADPAAGRSETVEAAGEVAAAQSRLHTASRKLVMLERVDQYVLPVLQNQSADPSAAIITQADFGCNQFEAE